MSKPAFALKETLATKQNNKNIWFRFWSVIGPCSTPDETERALFHTRQDAMESSAFTHPFSFFEVFEVDGKVGDFNWNRG